MDTLTKSCDDTARMDTHEVAAYLLERLGRTQTAYLANSRSRSMPARWASSPGDKTHMTPGADKVRRLNAAHAVFCMIEKADSDQVARSWLISANPRLDGATPSDFIRDDKIGEVYRAAKAFVADAYYA